MQDDIQKTTWRILDYPIKDDKLEEAQIMIDGLLKDLRIQLKPDKFAELKKWLTKSFEDGKY